MLQLIRVIFFREYLLSVRRIGEWLNPLLFFVVVISIFPLAISPELALLHKIAPGLIWVAALLASVLNSERLFGHDFVDGSLEQWCLVPWPMPAIIFIKVVVQWLLMIVPLLIICPLMGLMLGMSAPELRVLVYSLLLGTPCLNLLSAMMVALTLGLPSSGVLLILLLLPLYVPILIFATGSVMQVSAGLFAGGQLAFLAALLVLLITCMPYAIAAALRLSISQS